MEYKFTIPKKLHFIWLGGELPEKYFRNITSFIVHNYDYEVTLYIEKEIHYYNTLYKAGHSSLWNKRIKLEKLENVCREIYKFIPETRKLTTCLYQELIGNFCNKSAAADILRLFVLYLYGGVYLDVDLSVKFNADGCANLFGKLECKHGFLFHVQESIINEGLNGNNDILASVPRAPLIKQMIITCIERYTDLMDEGLIWYEKRIPENMGTSTFGDDSGCRNYFTLTTSGPFLVCDILEKFLPDLSILEMTSELSFPLTHLSLRCDNTWQVKPIKTLLDNGALDI